MRYIRFYNLRSYDRINTNAAMSKVEEQAGVSYDDARKGYVSGSYTSNCQVRLIAMLLTFTRALGSKIWPYCQFSRVRNGVCW